MLAASIRQLRRSTLLAPGIALAAVVALAACAKVSYPRCQKDLDCLGHGEVCVQGQCQECATAAHCLSKYPGENRVCQAGRCERVAECLVTADCQAKGHDLVCRGGACVPECTRTEDCQAGQKCVSQKCVAGCAADLDCPNDGVCVSGACMDAASAAQAGHKSCRPTKAGDLVRLDTVRFPFNQTQLSDEAHEALVRAADCLKQLPASARVLVEGHCDDRGTQEYNLALGERRANAVVKYLESLGAPTGQLEVVSKGENEPTCSEATEACYASNRRVQFLQQQNR